MNFAKDLCFKKCCSFELFIPQRVLKKNSTESTKILSSTTVFNIDIFFSTKAEWFLKDHVTLKIENSAFKNKNKNHISPKFFNDGVRMPFLI